MGNDKYLYDNNGNYVGRASDSPPSSASDSPLLSILAIALIPFIGFILLMGGIYLLIYLAAVLL